MTSTRSAVFVAVDIGATHARVGIFSSTSATKPLSHQVFKISRKYRTDLKRLTETITELIAGRTLAGVAIAVAGAVSTDRKKILASGNLTDWVGKPLAADVRKQLKCPVQLINDAEASALGEALLRKERTAFWHIIWGTGVGGSLVTYMDRQPVVTAGELGHQILDPHDTQKPDGCGQSGCLESFAGGAGIERRYGKPAADLSEREWQEVCESMAQGLYNLVISRPTESVVFAGGVALNQRKRVQIVERLLRKNLKMVPAPTLRVTSHRESAALVGALATLA
ncbi:ROK family protein [Patescibacteria group bacterium]|nr:ROK family protein [Patescibacteria group bacterium]